MIPAGINVAALALSVVGTVKVEHFRSLGRQTNAIGLDVGSFADPVEVRGQWQPVPRSVYQQLGLDLQKSYVNFVTQADLTDITRDTGGDQIERFGRRWQVLSGTPWGDVAGFSKYLLVRIPPPNAGAPA